MNKLIFIFLAIFNVSAWADEVVVNDLEVRKSIIKNGRVWQRPAWMDESFQFSPQFDIKTGPELTGNLKLLKEKEVLCQTSEEDQTRTFGGKTSKFFCQLMGPSASGEIELKFKDKTKQKRELIKVKYHPPNDLNNEVYGEVLGSRLLWALGFGADRMYPVEKVRCYGCSADPFEKRFVDSSTLQTPREFNFVSIEKKLEGDEVLFSIPAEKLKEIKKELRNCRNERTCKKEVYKAYPEYRTPPEGWSFRELMEQLPDEMELRKQEFVRRDALRLLAIFLQHTDLKPPNQRIVCPGKYVNGACQGQHLLMIQDIGSSFGVRAKDFGLDKVNLETWKTQPVWSKPSICKARIASKKIRLFLDDQTMNRPEISEEGRQFLVQLLEAFTRGEAGLARVRDLFLAANVESRDTGETVQMWVDAFMDRVKQIKYPMGENHPNFKCPDENSLVVIR